jgi:hypothetical protein
MDFSCSLPVDPVHPLPNILVCSLLRFPVQKALLSLKAIAAMFCSVLPVLSCAFRHKHHFQLRLYLYLQLLYIYTYTYICPLHLPTTSAHYFIYNYIFSYYYVYIYRAATTGT